MSQTESCIVEGAGSSQQHRVFQENIFVGFYSERNRVPQQHRVFQKRSMLTCPCDNDGEDRAECDRRGMDTSGKSLMKFYIVK